MDKHEEMDCKNEFTCGFFYNKIMWKDKNTIHLNIVIY